MLANFIQQQLQCSSRQGYDHQKELQSKEKEWDKATDFSFGSILFNFASRQSCKLFRNKVNAPRQFETIALLFY